MFEIFSFRENLKKADTECFGDTTYNSRMPKTWETANRKFFHQNSSSKFSAEPPLQSQKPPNTTFLYYGCHSTPQMSAKLALKYGDDYLIYDQNQLERKSSLMRERNENYVMIQTNFW